MFSTHKLKMEISGTLNQYMKSAGMPLMDIPQN